MAALTMSDVLAVWGARLQAAADNYPAVSFDGRKAMPAWLLDVAREQAQRVFLILDGTPPERRDLGWAEDLIEKAGLDVLLGWASAMETFGADREPWAKAAADEAVKVYRDHLDELAPGLHQGGRA